MESFATVLQNPNQRPVVDARDAITKTEVVWPKATQATAGFEMRGRGD